MRAALYARISLDRDGDKASPDRQIADCRALAERKGLEVVGEYVDRDTSAYKRTVRRPEYERMLAEVRAGHVDVIVFWKLDRITRQGWRGLAELIDLGVKLVSVNEELDTSSAMGEGMAGLIAQMGKAESENISLRVKRARQAAAEAGRMSSGGPRPYGYTRSGELVPDEADIIREVARRSLEGESFRRIAVDLNARNVCTSTGAAWQSSVLAEMVRSPLRAGLVVHRGEIVGEAPARRILTLEQYQRLNVAKSEPRAYRQPHHLLAGILFCAECGGRMKHRHSQYLCVKAPGLPYCGSTSVVANTLEKYVIADVFRVMSGHAIDPTTTANAAVVDAERLRAELAEDEQALNDLSRARYVDRMITDTEFVAALAPLRARVERTNAQLAELNEQRQQAESVRGFVPGSLESLERWWESATDVERRDAIQTVVPSVRVHRARKLGCKFDPSRVDIGVNWELLVRLVDNADVEPMSDAELRALPGYHDET